MKPPHVRWISRIFIIFVCIVLLSINTPVPSHAEIAPPSPIDSNIVIPLNQSPIIIVNDYVVEVGETLTIEPGVELRFLPGVSLIVNGTLIARGTQNLPIRFTSNQNPKAPGDWGGIEFTFESTGSVLNQGLNYVSGSILENCIVEFGGADRDYVIDARNLLVDNCSVQFNASRGIRNIATSETSVVRNSTIEENIATQPLPPGSDELGGGGVYSNGNCHILHNTISGNDAGVFAPGNRGGGIYSNGCEIQNNIVYNNTAGDKGGGVYAEQSLVRDNEIYSNLADKGGGVFAQVSSLASNKIYGNQADTGGGVASEKTSLADNILGHNVASKNGGGIYASLCLPVDDCVISRNSIIANVSGFQGGGLSFSGSATITDNTIVDNRSVLGSINGGLELFGVPVLFGNTIYANYPYDVVYSRDSSQDMTADNNYWGTDNLSTIASRIYDGQDSPSYGLFIITSVSPAPSPAAPLPPPVNFRVTISSRRAVLRWDTVPGYSGALLYDVYYDTDSPLPSFEGSGLDPGPSPRSVGASTSLTLENLTLFQPYFVALRSTHPGDDRVSWYSTVKTVVVGSLMYMPIIRCTSCP